MSRIQKILGVMLVILVVSLSYYIYKPHSQKTTVMDASGIRTPSKKQLKEMGHKDTTLHKEVTYSQEPEQQDIPGYSNPDEHQ